MRTRHRTKHPGVYYRLDAKGARRYIVWFKDARGKAHTSHLPLGCTLEDAKEHRAGLIKSPKTIPTKMLVRDLLDEWLVRRELAVSESTMFVYEWAVDRLKQEIGQMKVADVTADTVVSLRRGWVAEGLKKHSINNLEIPLRMSLASAARDDLIPASPYTKILRHEAVRADQKEMRCLSSNEIRLLLKQSKSFSDPFEPLVALLLTSGLRISEALTLSWDDVDFSNGLIHVRKGKTKNATRSVMLIAATGSLLKAFKLRSEPGPQVFPTTHSKANKALAKACLAAGIPRCTPHELRHTYASILINQRETPVFVCSQMGHANPHVTYTVYAHLFDAQDRVDEARERLQAAFGGLV